MNEHMIPIPSRIYNAAVGGHVCGAVDIVDDALGLEQSSINEDVAPMPYNDGNPNGMGRIILKKTDNFKNVVEAQSGNTIFIIKYDFTLTGNVTIPANCVLEFDGGSISGHTIDFNDCLIEADKNLCIFKNLTNFSGIKEFSVKWFGAKGDLTTDDTAVFRFLCNRNYTNTAIIHVPAGIYRITNSINPDALSLGHNFILNGVDGEYIPEGNMRISDFVGKNKSIIYCEGNSNIPYLYAPAGLYHIFLRGEDNNDFSTYTALRPKYDNTIGLCMHTGIVETESYYTGCIMNDVKIMLFGKGIYQGAGFAHKCSNIDIYRCVYGWYIDMPENSYIGNLITEMEVYDVHIHASIKTGLYIYSKWYSHIVFRKITVEHSNVDNIDGEYEIYQHGGDITLDGLYTENKGQVVNKTNGYFENGFINCSNSVLHAGTYIFKSRTELNTCLSRDAKVTARELLLMHSYLNALTMLDGYEPVVINSTITNNNYYNDFRFATDISAVYAWAHLEQVYANRKNTPMFITADDKNLGWTKIGNTVYKVPLIRGKLNNTTMAGREKVINTAFWASDLKKLLFHAGTTTPLDVFGRYGALPLHATYTPTAATVQQAGDNIGFVFFSDTLKKPMFFSGDTANGKSGWVDTYGADATVPLSGTFANKPSASKIYVGFKYFCTDKQTTEGATNGIEIIHKGDNVWVDALGRVVS